MWGKKEMGFNANQYVFVHFCSHDYQQQRSITSASIETTIDDTNDKRDDRRHRQPQQQQQYPSNSNERSYTQGTNILLNYLIFIYCFYFLGSKYGSNHKVNI